MLHSEQRVVCLQRYPEFYEQTITLLNNQWPRSRTARLRSLEQGSADSLPTSLILIQKDDNGKEEVVVAHSKISPVPYQPQLCFIESVVVSPELRGKGLGRQIMDSTESYVKSLGIHTVYLTTFDQQGFYGKLGYEFCDPIVVFGGSMKLAEKTDNFKIYAFTTQKPEPDTNINDRKLENELQASKTDGCGSPVPPPPPPPPLPSPQTLRNNNNNAIQASKVTMRKILN